METKSTNENVWHYLPLLGAVFIGLVGFWMFSYDRVFQTFISILVSVLYVLWGVMHHKAHNDLTLSVVLEYLLIAFLGLTIIFSLLFRS